MSAVTPQMAWTKAGPKDFWYPPPNPSTSRQSQKASNVDEALQTRESRRMLRYAGQAESELRRAREDLKVVEWIEFKPRRGMRSTKLNRSSWSTKDLKARNEAGKGKKCGRPKGSGRTRSVCAALRTKRRRATGSGANRVVGRVDTPLPKKMHAATRPSIKEALGMHRRPDKHLVMSCSCYVAKTEEEFHFRPNGRPRIGPRTKTEEEEMQP